MSHLLPKWLHQIRKKGWIDDYWILVSEGQGGLCLAYPLLVIQVSVITGFIQAYNQMNFTEMEPSASPIVFFSAAVLPGFVYLGSTNEKSTDFIFWSHHIFYFF